MGSICYTWTNSPFTWDNARLSWADFCVVLTPRSGTAFSKNKKWRKRHEEDKIEEDIDGTEEKEEEIFSSEEELSKILKENSLFLY
jgi:hypothetical protein